MNRLGLEEDKPELARVMEKTSKLQDQTKETVATVDESLKRVTQLKTEKKDLKLRIVSAAYSFQIR